MKTKNYFRLKNLFLLSALFIFTIALALSSYADVITCAIIEPDSSDTVTTGTVLNASFTGGNGNATMTLYINFSSSSTANSSVGTLISSTTNSTPAMANGSINSSLLSAYVLEDANNYAVEMAVEGGDGNGRADCTGTASNVIVDRTAPSAPTSLSPSGTNTSTTLNFTSTVTGTDTTGCTLSFTSTNPGQKDYAMTHSGDSCHLAISSIPKLTYIYTITASDGTNSSTSTSATVNIDGTGNQRRKAAAVGGALGGGMSKEKIGKGLAIAQATRAGEVSQGLAKAQAQISQFVERETQGKELTKTGIGLGTGIAIGILVPTLVIPGVGLITAPILGGLIGAGIGIAI